MICPYCGEEPTTAGCRCNRQYFVPGVSVQTVPDLPPVLPFVAWPRNADPARTPDMRTCAKCGNDLVRPWHHRGAEDCGNVLTLVRIRQPNEHLHYRCNCGHEWIESCADAKAKP